MDHSTTLALKRITYSWPKGSQLAPFFFVALVSRLFFVCGTKASDLGETTTGKEKKRRELKMMEEVKMVVARPEDEVILTKWRGWKNERMA